MVLASGLAQGEPTAPQQKGSAVTPAAQTKSADAVKPKPVPASKPAPAVKSLYPVKTNLPEVAKVKPAPPVKPDVVAKIKPVPAVKPLYPVKTNLPEVAKEKPAPAVKSAPVAKVKRVEPVAAVVVFREPTKTQKLAALLESYKANEITPTQYHDGRAALIARQ